MKSQKTKPIESYFTVQVKGIYLLYTILLKYNQTTVI